MQDLVKENYNSHAIATLWGQYIDWEGRRKGERGFLVNALKEFDARKILNLATGDGCDSIYLAQNGFEVVNNEYDPAFRKVAQKNIKKANLDLDTYNYDWREIARRFPHGFFDASLCLGNSFCYLFTREAQKKALDNFKILLRGGGILVVDERNWPYFFKRKDSGATKSKFLYCGENVTFNLRKDLGSKLEFEMHYKGEPTGEFITLYPFKRGELLELLEQAGFRRILRYSDYKLGVSDNANYYQYICVK